jgi:hypothetical protein
MLFWRRTLAVSRTACLACFLAVLVFGFYLSAERPRQPQAELDMTVPEKLWAGIVYVRPLESQILHSVMFAGVILAGITIYCSRKTTTPRA